MSKNKKQDGKSYGFHCGLEFVLAHNDDEIEEIIKKLEAKRNRRAMAKKNRTESLNSLQKKLRANLGTKQGIMIEAELNMRFEKMRRIRMKG